VRKGNSWYFFHLSLRALRLRESLFYSFIYRDYAARTDKKSKSELELVGHWLPDRILTITSYLIQCRSFLCLTGALVTYQ
jgi:hypothetical protein